MNACASRLIRRIAHSSNHTFLSIPRHGSIYAPKPIHTPEVQCFSRWSSSYSTASSTNNESNSVNWINSPYGLQYQDLKEGTGGVAKEGHTILIHYSTNLPDGTKFDGSRDRGEPMRFRIGSDSVIKGWNYGILGMKKGGVRKLRIPPQLGFGDREILGILPPYATLICEIELIDIIPLGWWGFWQRFI